jgi:hypothetical protein
MIYGSQALKSSGRRGIRIFNSAIRMKIIAKEIKRIVVAYSNIFFIHIGHLGALFSNLATT